MYKAARYWAYGMKAPISRSRMSSEKIQVPSCMEIKCTRSCKDMANKGAVMCYEGRNLI